ncbi:hypothetical protein [Limnoraphis robusta]|uniref:hypothetical protein n=1 Tax=Limnoraphis robusta TaxID=1118279 RepID=UPI002B1E9A86|nr:hypothetical protein [Limnoraphis robusta]MEA5500393.1 hypothetical protein [Limnoraphis robusta BA-68 BA1]
MTTFKPLCIALTGILAVSIPFQKAQAATLFSGVGDNAATAFAAMKAAIGGLDNTTAIGPQIGGFRTVNWDGVLLDGTDFGGNTQVIVPDQVVGIPEDRFLSRGALYDDVYIVSGDGLESVNSGVAGQFPAFSPNNIFVHFGEDDNEIDQSFTLAGTTTPAATRGFGAIFLDVELPNTSSIEFFNGSVSLGKYFVEPGGSGLPSFLGVLFDEPVITEVELILGNNTIFDVDLDSNTITSGPADDPENGIDLVATDDFIYAEPEVAQEIPEPSALVALFLVGLFPKFCWKKQ